MEVAKEAVEKVEVAKGAVEKVEVVKVAVEKVEVAKVSVEKVEVEKVALTVWNGRKRKTGMNAMNGKMMFPKEKVELAKVTVEKVKVAKENLEKVKVAKENLEKVKVAKVKLVKEDLVKEEVVNVKEKEVQEKENAKTKATSSLLKDARKHVNLAVLELNVPGVAGDLFVTRGNLQWTHKVGLYHYCFCNIGDFHNIFFLILHV